MSAPIRLDDAFGYLTFEFDPPAGAPPDAAPPGPVRLDVYEANAAYLGLHQKHSDADALMVAWRDHLYTLGFPPMSRANGLAVVRAVQAEIGRLGKADGDSARPG